MGRSGLSRRDFLKVAGVGGVGLAGGAVLSRDLDDLVTSPQGAWQRPSWVRRVDKPTTGVDWERVKRYDERNTMRRGHQKYVGKEEFDRLARVDEENMKQKLASNEPGYTLRDRALNAGSGAGQAARSFLGPGKAATPADLGVARWQATPEENGKMVRAALRHFGASTVGYVELDGHTERLIYSVDPDGKQLVFAAVDGPAENETTRTIPMRAKWVIVYTVQMSEETLKRAPTVTGSQTTGLTYTRAANIQARLQEFLRGLGYVGLGEASTNALGIAPALGVMAGLGELGRINRLVTPEYGPMTRVFKLVTDLPLAGDGPIDAGIAEFCKTCKRCAEACSSGALSTETQPTWEILGLWNNPGHQAWFEDSRLCRKFQREEAGTNCGVCFAVCPFAKKDKSFMHSAVKSAVSTAPVLDGFFTRMDRAAGYGLKDAAEWWDLELPEYGIDTTIGSRG